MRLGLISFIGIFIFCLNPLQVKANQLDSLMNLLSQEEIQKDDLRQMDLYLQLGRLCFRSQHEDYEKSINYYDKALTIAEQEGEDEVIIKCYYGLGLGHQRKNNFQESLSNFNKVVSFSDGDVNFKTKAGSYSQISAIYQALGDYEQAYESQMQALLIYEINEVPNGIANSHYNLGNIFYYQDQYESALEHYQEASVICKKEGNQKFIFATSSALGAVHQKLKNEKKSRQYNQEALEMAETLNYKTGIGYAKANLAANFSHEKNYTKAEQLILEAILIKEELGDTYGSIGTKIDLGELYHLWGKDKKAILVLEESLAASKVLKSRAQQSEIYKLLVDVYEAAENPSAALMFSKKYLSLRDSVINEKTIEEMGKSKKQFELKEKEHEITILKKEKKIQKLQNYLFGLFLFGFGLFLWRYRKQISYQKKTNELLEEKNAEIQIQNSELQYIQDELVNSHVLLEDKNLLLEESNLELNDKNDEIKITNKQLENSNQDLQQFAYVASHDLKEPLRMIGSYTRILEKRYNHLYDDNGKEFMFFVTDAVKRMQNLLDDLLDFSKVGNEKAPEHPTELSDVLTLVEVNLRHRLESLNGEMIIEPTVLPALKAHRTQLIQLFQNLISNGVKFKGERDPKVFIDYIKKEKETVFSVRDNGIGISPENLKKVFDMFKRLHDQSEYEGTGIGLATCKRIVNGWGGDIWVESTEGEGSTFFFSVPNSAIVYSTKPELVNQR